MQESARRRLELLVQDGTPILGAAEREELFTARGARTSRVKVRGREMLVKGDPAIEVRKLKQGSGRNLTVLGSGSLVAQFARAGLIDEYEILINPVVLGSGKTMFEGVKDRFRLRLVSSRVFGNGNVLLTYERAR